MTKKKSETPQTPSERFKAEAAAREEKRAEREKTTTEKYSTDRRGGNYFMIDGVRVHESDVPAEQREKLGLPPLPETPAPDEGNA